jgi:uroporphyrinogen-III decarboxylase
VAAVEKACRDVIAVVGNAKGFILVPGCDIPPTIPYENLTKFHDVAFETKL